MQNNKEPIKTFCTECNAPQVEHVNPCPTCGHSVDAERWPTSPELEYIQSDLKEYRLLQVLGIGVTLGGVVAIVAESPLAAAVSIAIGIATCLTGLIGAWWNRNH